MEARGRYSLPAGPLPLANSNSLPEMLFAFCISTRTLLFRMGEGPIPNGRRAHYEWGEGPFRMGITFRCGRPHFVAGFPVSLPSPPSLPSPLRSPPDSLDSLVSLVPLASLVPLISIISLVSCTQNLPASSIQAFPAHLLPFPLPCSAINPFDPLTP
jgi:hypothetical protein